MSACAVTLIQTDPSDDRRVVALQKRIPPECDVMVSQRASNDFITFIQALARHHVRHASRQWPLFYLVDTVTSPWVEKLPAIASSVSAKDPFTLCYLHRWNDRCDFLTEIQPLSSEAWAQGYARARTRNAHGTEAFLISWRGLCNILNDEMVRKTVEHLKIDLALPPFDPSIPHNASNASWAQWTTLPSRDMLLDIKSSPAGQPSPATGSAAEGYSPLDVYLCQLIKNTRTVTACCVTPCLFQWSTPHTTRLNDYEKTHECARVTVETESRAYRAARQARDRVKEIPRAFEWILILLLIVIGLVIWYKSAHRKNKTPV